MEAMASWLSGCCVLAPGLLRGKGWQLMLAELGFELNPGFEFNPEVIPVIDKCCWYLGGQGLCRRPGRRCHESPDLSPQGTKEPVIPAEGTAGVLNRKAARAQGTLRPQGLITLGLQSSETWGVLQSPGVLVSV